MTSEGNSVLLKQGPISEARFHDLLVAGFARVAAKLGKGTLADRMGRTVRALDNIFAGSTPSAKAMLDALRADETVLDELLRSYGFRLAPLHDRAANDLHTAAGLSHAAASIIESLEDGERQHQETLVVADKLRPHVPSILAIIAEADRLRGAA